MYQGAAAGQCQWILSVHNVNTGHHEHWSPVTTTQPSPPAPWPLIGQSRPHLASDWSMISLRSRISRMICPEMRPVPGAGLVTGISAAFKFCKRIINNEYKSYLFNCDRVVNKGGAY